MHRNIIRPSTLVAGALLAARAPRAAVRGTVDASAAAVTLLAAETVAVARSVVPAPDGARRRIVAPVAGVAVDPVAHAGHRVVDDAATRFLVRDRVSVVAGVGGDDSRFFRRRCVEERTGEVVAPRRSSEDGRRHQKHEDRQEKTDSV